MANAISVPLDAIGRIRTGERMTSEATRGETLIGLLTLDRVRDNLLVGAPTPPAYSLGRGRVCSGVAIAQALAAAMSTLAPDRLATSLHCRFLRPGIETEPLRFTVERDLDGARVSQRRVVADQGGAPVITASGMFRKAQGGPGHRDPTARPAAPEVAKAELDTLRRRPEGLPHALKRFLGTPRLFEMLPTEAGRLDATGEDPRRSACGRNCPGETGKSRACARPCSPKPATPSSCSRLYSAKA